MNKFKSFSMLMIFTFFMISCASTQQEHNKFDKSEIERLHSLKYQRLENR